MNNIIKKITIDLLRGKRFKEQMDFIFGMLFEVTKWYIHRNIEQPFGDTVENFSISSLPLHLFKEILLYKYYYIMYQRYKD